MNNTESIQDLKKFLTVELTNIAVLLVCLVILTIVLPIFYYYWIYKYKENNLYSQILIAFNSNLTMLRMLNARYHTTETDVSINS